MPQILIIDNNVNMLRNLKKMLEHEGYSVRCATNQRDALKLYRRRRADLLITDILMARMEGIQCMNRIRDNAHDIKTIAVSGSGIFSDEEYCQLGELFGIDATFIKPFLLKDLLGQIKQMVH